jgi:hypothetical protein
MHVGKPSQPQVSANSCKYVIFIAIIYVIRIAHGATTMKSDSSEDLEDLSGKI